MIRFFIGLLSFLSAYICSRFSLGLAILALRQRPGARARKHPPHPHGDANELAKQLRHRLSEGEDRVIGRGDRIRTV